MRRPALQVACHELVSRVSSGGGGTGDANTAVLPKRKRKRERKSGRRAENLI
jgi:hypothetical protein